MLKLIVQAIISSIINSIIKGRPKNNAPVEEAKPTYEKTPHP